MDAEDQGRGRGRLGLVGLVVAALLLVGVVPATASHEGTLDSACPGPAVPQAGFTDVDDGATHRATIDCLVWHGVTQGRSWARFDPGGEVRRDEMASLLARAMERAGAELPASPGDHFDDVAAGSVHAHAINQLADLDVVAGTSARRYSPDRLVTRAQAAALLVRGSAAASASSGTGPLARRRSSTFAGGHRRRGRAVRARPPPRRRRQRPLLRPLHRHLRRHPHRPVRGLVGP